MLGLALSVPSKIGTLKSLSFFHHLLATSMGPTFYTAFRDKIRHQLVHFGSSCIHEGVGEEERKKENSRSVNLLASEEHRGGFSFWCLQLLLNKPPQAELATVGETSPQPPS